MPVVPTNPRIDAIAWALGHEARIHLERFVKGGRGRPAGEDELALRCAAMAVLEHLLLMYDVEHRNAGRSPIGHATPG